MKEESYSIVAIVVVVLVVVLGAAAFFWWNTPATPGTPVNTATSTQVTYVNPSLHYTISYPDDFTPNTAYSYQALGPDQTINGVSFIIPASLAAGTNLSSNSYISVESMATSTCSALAFLGETVTTSTQSITDSGITYNFARGGGAGAGNFYQEYVYAVTGTNPCIAVRYFIHSTNIGNYPPGTVTEFNQANLLAAFDGIRRSLKLNQ